jgi:hypothetical protein
MAMIDAFKSAIFKFANLMTHVTNAPYQPGQLTRSGLWTSGPGLTSTTAIIDISDTRLNLLDVTARTGATHNVRHEDKGQSVSVEVPHIEDYATLAADLVLAARQLGTENANQVLSNKVTERMSAILIHCLYCCLF